MGRGTIGAVGTFVTYILGIVIVGGLLFLIASFVFGRGEELAPTPANQKPVELADPGTVSGDHVRSLRLPVTVRGYRMADVDWVLERLAAAIDERDRQLARLRVPVTAPVPPEAVPEPEGESNRD